MPEAIYPVSEIRFIVSRKSDTRDFKMDHIWFKMVMAEISRMYRYAAYYMQRKPKWPNWLPH